MKKKEQKLREMWEIIKYTDICMFNGTVEERERNRKNIEAIIAEDLPNLMKNTVQIQEA